MHQGIDLQRRQFLKLSTGTCAGLALGFPVSWVMAGNSRAAVDHFARAWVQLLPTGDVVIQLPKAEMGQGIFSSIAAIIADEMDLPLEKVVVEFASNNATLYDPKTGASDITGGSGSIRGGNFEKLRTVGASAREMIRLAAAEVWGTAETKVDVKDGYAVHKLSRKQLSYGELTEAAAKVDIPDKPFLKSKSEWRYIGKEFKRLDTPKKVNGQALFTLDLKVPGVVYAAVGYAPMFQGKAKGIQSLRKEAKAKGAMDLVELPDGVAVIAGSYWQAQQICDGLALEWDYNKKLDQVSSATISTELRAAARSREGALVAHEKNWQSNSGNDGVTTVEAEYEVPYLAHSTMEPMNAIAHVEGGKVTVWVAHQGEGLTKREVASALQIDVSKVTVITTFLGGGFGRRALMDHAVSAALISKAVGKPVHLIYSRETDMTHDGYRPAFAAHLKATLGKDGMPTTWQAQNAGSAIMISRGWQPPGQIDRTSAEGFKEIHYDIKSQKITHKQVDLHVPVWFWRSVGSSQNAFFVESFIDELAHKAKQDPLTYRTKLLKDSPRHKKVLEVAAAKAGWGKSQGKKGFGEGIALAESFGSIVAQVVQVQIDQQKREFKIERVICAIDCGSVVNPNVVQAQMMSSVHCGLSSCLKGAITLKSGRVEQTNFDSYRLLSMAEMPPVETHIVESGADMGGVGEPGVPPTAPALCNAVFAATGKRIRQLPLEPQLFS